MALAHADPPASRRTPRPALLRHAMGRRRGRPGRSLDLRSYLLLYFHSDSVILGPIGDAGLSSLLADGAERPVEPTTRLVADRHRSHPDQTRDQYRLPEVLSGETMPLERDQRFGIDNRRWRSAWG